MEIVYIADIDQDIDDIIAIDLLNSEGVLSCVVLDPMPKSDLGKQRVNQIKSLGIIVKEEIPECNIVFNGGAFTKLAKYLENNELTLVVANGGYVGDNMTLEKDILDKFRGIDYCRTYNFNIDVKSAMKVIESRNLHELVLIGKNVCHNIKNTTQGIWKHSALVEKYNIKNSKRLHDVLMVQEGLKFIRDEDSLLEFSTGTPVLLEDKGRNSSWGTEEGNEAIIAVGWK